MKDHLHVHAPGCACGCHKGAPNRPHGEAQALVERTLVLSKAWSGTEGSPADLAERVRSGLSDLAGQVAEDGIIWGHLKVLLCCGGAALAFSVTRADTVDETPSPLWPPAAPADWTLTVNVLSLVHTDAVTEETLDVLFG